MVEVIVALTLDANNNNVKLDDKTRYLQNNRT